MRPVLTNTFDTPAEIYLAPVDCRGSTPVMKNLAVILFFCTSALLVFASDLPANQRLKRKNPTKTPTNPNQSNRVKKVLFGNTTDAPITVPAPQPQPERNLPNSFEVVPNDILRKIASYSFETPTHLKNLLTVDKRFYNVIQDNLLWIPLAISSGHPELVDASAKTEEQRDSILSWLITEGSPGNEHRILSSILNCKTSSSSRRLAMMLLREGPFRRLTESHVNDLVKILWPADKPADKGLAVTLSKFISENYFYFRSRDHLSPLDFLKTLHKENKKILLSALCKIAMRIETSFESPIDVPVFLNEIGTLLKCDDILHLSKLSRDILTPDVSIVQLARWFAAEKNMDVKNAWLSIIVLSLEYVSANEYQKELGRLVPPVHGVFIPEFPEDPLLLDLQVLLNPTLRRKHEIPVGTIERIIQNNFSFDVVLAHIGSQVKNLDDIDRQMIMNLSNVQGYGELVDEPLVDTASIILLISVDPDVQNHPAFDRYHEYLHDSCQNQEAMHIYFGTKFAVHLTPAKRTQILDTLSHEIIFPMLDTTSFASLDTCSRSAILLNLYEQVHFEPSALKVILEVANNAEFELLLLHVLNHVNTQIPDYYVVKLKAVEFFCEIRPVIAAQVLINYIGENSDLFYLLNHDIKPFVFLFADSDLTSIAAGVRLDKTELLSALNSYPSDFFTYGRAVRRMASYLQKIRIVHNKILSMKTAPSFLPQ